MKASIILLLVGLAVAQAQFQWLSDSAKFVKDAAGGSRDMYRAYRDMREANYKNSDKYFHARGNYDAAQRGPGGSWAAKVISNEEKPSRREAAAEERRTAGWTRKPITGGGTEVTPITTGLRGYPTNTKPRLPII
ncbi:serum amyloid A-3 protein-like [Aquarana catesbeiana]|uniref:serum amyloid A-3 protein-like n=1 Tax=Aquarana catesbeiana TaxID=8400 RepID=UPI003CC9F6F5